MGGGVSNPLPEGLTVSVYGHDGSSYIILKVDSAGRLKVVTEVSALPSGAATSAHQLTMISALQLIDDLRGALQSAGTDSLRVRPGMYGGTWNAIRLDVTGAPQVDVLSSALPTGAATAAHQVTLHGKFQDQAFTYKGQVYQKNSHVKVGDGTYTQVGAAVPAGEIWIITGMTANDWHRELPVIYVGLDKADVQYWGGSAAPALARAGAFLPSPMVLVEGDKPAAYYYGALNNDALTMTVIGYSMTKAT